MGYTHYWQATRNFTLVEWETVSEDMRTLLSHIEHARDVRLCDGMGERGTKPEFTRDYIRFNGSGDDSHETFVINRRRPPKESWQPARGFDFCKTARKPYDVAVTAALCYLSSVAETHSVSSDGSGTDFLLGLEAARTALPRLANQLDIPLGVMEDDRWCPPFAHHYTDDYQLKFCVDGYAYIIDTKTKESYRFLSHHEAAQWAESHREGYGRYSIFNPYGSFDRARRRALKKAQNFALKQMISLAKEKGRQQPPPLFVRPGEMLPPEGNAYSFTDVLALSGEGKV